MAPRKYFGSLVSRCREKSCHYSFEIDTVGCGSVHGAFMHIPLGWRNLAAKKL